MKFTPNTHAEDYYAFLRRHTPRAKTSTWRKDSPQAILGEAAEIVVRDRLQKVLQGKGLNWSVVRRADQHNPDDPRNAIENSNEGDVHVIDHRGRRRASFEVKASLEWPNATISESELLYSDADYLVGVTTVGLWVCSMDSARSVAQKKRNASGTFYVIPHDLVSRLSFDILFKNT